MSSLKGDSNLDSNEELINILKTVESNSESNNINATKS